MGNSNDKSRRDSVDSSSSKEKSTKSRIKRLSFNIDPRPSPKADDPGKNKLPNTKLSSEGQTLLASTMQGASPESPSLERASSSQKNLAQYGASILNSGLNASNKKRIQDFARETSPDCADCFEGDMPKWCVLGFGVFVCDECAGAHRALPASLHGGVRSLYLDEWTDEMVKHVFTLGGNKVVNDKLEYHVPAEIYKPRKGISSGSSRKDWVRRKYESKQFAKADGMVRRPALPVQPSPLKYRAESFAAGKQVLVGVVDVVVLQVSNLPKSLFRSTRLSSGFVLSVSLGRFKSKTSSTFSGRKWIGQRMHLSWDGQSNLEVSILMGSSKVIARAVRTLDEFKNPGNQTLEFELNFTPSKEKSPNNNDDDDGTDEKPGVISVALRVDFIDLRS